MKRSLLPSSRQSPPRRSDAKFCRVSRTRMYYNPRRDTIKTTETSNQRLSGLNVSFIIIWKGVQPNLFVSIVHAKHLFLSISTERTFFLILSICVQIDFPFSPSCQPPHSSLINRFSKKENQIKQSYKCLSFHFKSSFVPPRTPRGGLLIIRSYFPSSCIERKSFKQNMKEWRKLLRLRQTIDILLLIEKKLES